MLLHAVSDEDARVFEGKIVELCQKGEFQPRYRNVMYALLVVTLIHLSFFEYA